MKKIKRDTALAIVSVYIGVGVSAIFFGLTLFYQQYNPATWWWLVDIIFGVALMVIPLAILRKSLK